MDALTDFAPHPHIPVALGFYPRLADVQALVDAHRRFVGATNTLMRIHTQRLSAGGVV